MSTELTVEHEGEEIVVRHKRFTLYLPLTEAESFAWAIEDAVAGIRAKLKPPTRPQVVDGASP